MDDVGLARDLARFAHILVFVYWLGADAGVFYASRCVVDPTRSREARLTAARIFAGLDLLPRCCMAVTLTVGGVLAEFAGIGHEPWEMVAILLLGPVWLGLVLLAHVHEGSARGRLLQRADLALRWIVIAALLVSVAHAVATGRLAGQAWVAAKLLIFAALVYCGLMIRRHLGPFSRGFQQLASAGATPESDALMAAAMARCLPWVFLIWTGVLASALIGAIRAFE